MVIDRDIIQSLCGHEVSRTAPTGHAFSALRKNSFHELSKIGLLPSFLLMLRTRWWVFRLGGRGACGAGADRNSEPRQRAEHPPADGASLRLV